MIQSNNPAGKAESQLAIKTLRLCKIYSNLEQKSSDRCRICCSGLCFKDREAHFLNFVLMIATFNMMIARGKLFY